jgi:hypothetical protein
MTRPWIPLKLEDLSNGLRMSLREDGSLTPERREISRKKLDKEKSDKKFLNSEITVMLIHQPPKMRFLKKNQTKKQVLLKPLKKRNKPKPKRKLIVRKLRKN